MSKNHAFFANLLAITAIAGLPIQHSSNAQKKSKEINERLMKAAEEKRQRKAIMRMKEQA